MKSLLVQAFLGSFAMAATQLGCYLQQGPYMSETNPTPNLSDFSQIQTTYKQGMSVSKIKLCTVEMYSATWLASWQTTYSDGTSLQYQGLYTGSNFECQDFTITSSITSAQIKTRHWDSSGKEAVNYLKLTSSDGTQYSIGNSNEANSNQASVTFQNEFLGFLGYLSETIETIGFFEMYSTCNCLSTQLLAQSIPSLYASANTGEADTYTISPSFEDTYSFMVGSQMCGSQTYSVTGGGSSVVSIKNQNELVLQSANTALAGTHSLSLVVALTDYPSITLTVPFTAYLFSLEANVALEEEYTVGDDLVELPGNQCVLMPDDVTGYQVQYSGDGGLPGFVLFDQGSNVYQVYTDQNTDAGQTYTFENTCFVQQFSTYEQQAVVSLDVLENPDQDDDDDPDNDGSNGDKDSSDDENISIDDLNNIKDDEQRIKYWLDDHNKYAAALQYYKWCHKMYLLKESDGPYLNATHGQIAQDNWFYYNFTEPFVIQYSYGDLSWNPELDILTEFVDLGPSMIFVQKQLFQNTRQQKFLRLSTWREVTPGNYTVLVNLTNTGLVEKTFFININVPFIAEEIDTQSGIVVDLNTVLQKVEIDQFGLITLKFQTLSDNSTRQLLEDSSTWQDFIQLEFSWYSVQNMNYSFELVSQNPEQAQIQTTFEFPEYVSNYQYDLLYAKLNNVTLQTYVPPQAQQYIVFTKALALCLGALIIFTFISYLPILYCKCPKTNSEVLLFNTWQYLQAMVYLSLLNAPVSAHITEIQKVLFRVVSFDLTWTFLDNFQIPQVNQSSLDPSQVSYSILELKYTPHLLTNLKGTLCFTILFLLLAVLFPCISTRQQKYKRICWLFELVQLPIGFACLVEIKHAWWQGMPQTWEYWLEFIVSLSWLYFTQLVLPVTLALQQVYYKKFDFKTAFRVYIKNVLIGILVWGTYPMYQLWTLILMALICSVAIHKSMVVIVWFLMALRWDQTGLAGVILITVATVVGCMLVWVEILEILMWPVRKLCYPRCKSCYRRRTSALKQKLAMPEDSQKKPVALEVVVEETDESIDKEAELSQHHVENTEKELLQGTEGQTQDGVDELYEKMQQREAQEALGAAQVLDQEIGVQKEKQRIVGQNSIESESDSQEDDSQEGDIGSQENEKDDDDDGIEQIPPQIQVITDEAKPLENAAQDDEPATPASQAAKPQAADQDKESGVVPDEESKEIMTSQMIEHLDRVQDPDQNALVIEQDGQVMENFIFNGKISKIYLNPDQNLEISFDQKNKLDKSHVTIPIKDQIQAQQALNESVYIKIDMANEQKGMELEEMIFKVLPEGKVERQVAMGPYAESDMSQRDLRPTSYPGFFEDGKEGPLVVSRMEDQSKVIEQSQILKDVEQVKEQSLEELKQENSDHIQQRNDLEVGSREVSSGDNKKDSGFYSNQFQE